MVGGHNPINVPAIHIEWWWGTTPLMFQQYTVNAVNGGGDNPINVLAIHSEWWWGTTLLMFWQYTVNGGGEQPY